MSNDQPQPSPDKMNDVLKRMLSTPPAPKVKPKPPKQDDKKRSQP